MGQALYRKYRSRRFSEVIGQEHITKTLNNALKTGSISHAYLFTGPRGVGKTSVARILAHAVNNLKYDTDSVHLDIIEIDAASNRRIDEVRDLRDKVHIAPAAAKYKVYIIDEVHMLTREAFNALLKTLEEPPSHCIFILATTEAHKLPETIVSRTQRFTFKPIDKGQAASRLLEIAKKEGFQIDQSAAELLAEHGEGSFRDSLSMLDQVSSLGKAVKEKDVRILLGLPPDGLIVELLQAMEDGAPKKALEILKQLRAGGSNASQVAQHLSKELRNRLANGNQIPPWLPTTLKQLIEVSSSSNPDEFLDICILEAAVFAHGQDTRVKSSASGAGLAVQSATLSAKVTSAKSAEESAPKPKPSNASVSADSEFWPLLVEVMKHRAASIYTALKLAQPRIEHEKLTLIFEFGLHQNKIKQAKNIQLLQEAVEELTGRKVEIECIADKELFRSAHAAKDAPKKNPPLQAINNIFGPLEVLES